MSQVTTEHELLKRSSDLEDSLSQQQFVEFCEKKIQEGNDEKEKNIWSFLKVCSKIIYNVTWKLDLVDILYTCTCIATYFLEVAMHVVG